LLKVKTFHDDEATVYGTEFGSGRNEDVMGALLVRDKDGIEFKIGSGFTDELRRKKWTKGTVVT